MVALETAILAGLSLLNLCAIGFLAHWIRMHLDSAMMDIDSKLAIAIKTLIDKLMAGEMSDFEPPNARFHTLYRSSENEYYRRHDHRTRRGWTICAPSIIILLIISLLS